MIHAVPSAEEQLAFIRKLRRLLDEGSFVATYKYALLHAIADPHRQATLRLNWGVVPPGGSAYASQGVGAAEGHSLAGRHLQPRWWRAPLRLKSTA